MIGKYLNYALIILALLLPSCLPSGSSGPTSQVRINSVSGFKPSRLHPREYSARITELEQIAADSKANRRDKLQALHLLVLLHLAPDNPERSPVKAAAALTAWLEAAPQGQETEEGSIWLSMLRDYQDKEKLADDSAREMAEAEQSLSRLAEENNKLQQKLAKLEYANRELKEKIDKLKMIDLTVERKRKSMR